MTSLRLLTVVNVGFKCAAWFRKLGAERRAPRAHGLLTPFPSPPGEKNKTEPIDYKLVVRNSACCVFRYGRDAGLCPPSD